MRSMHKHMQEEMAELKKENAELRQRLMYIFWGGFEKKINKMTQKSYEDGIRAGRNKEKESAIRNDDNFKEGE